MVHLRCILRSVLRSLVVLPLPLLLFFAAVPLAFAKEATLAPASTEPQRVARPSREVVAFFGRLGQALRELDTLVRTPSGDGKTDADFRASYRQLRRDLRETLLYGKREGHLRLAETTAGRAQASEIGRQFMFVSPGREHLDVLAGVSPGQGPERLVYGTINLGGKLNPQRERWVYRDHQRVPVTLPNGLRELEHAGYTVDLQLDTGASHRITGNAGTRNYRHRVRVEDVGLGKLEVSIVRPRPVSKVVEGYRQPGVAQRFLVPRTKAPHPRQSVRTDRRVVAAAAATTR